jgi:uncharacterized protein YdeI (YjbR/CyaY-like superfamily)
MAGRLGIDEDRPAQRAYIGPRLPAPAPPPPFRTMGTRDPRVDAYIAKAPPFAQPILAHIREVVHEGCPDVVETMKWSSPFFDYAGSPLAMMAAFKQHCRFGFWKGRLVVGDDPFGEADGDDPKGPSRFASVGALPPKRTLLKYVKKAAALNADGVKVAKPARAKKPEAATPDDLAVKLAMKKHAKARAAFDAFSPSHRREYIEWITEAKTDATRQRRIEQTLAQLAEGKSRHWKYQTS